MTQTNNARRRRAPGPERTLLWLAGGAIAAAVVAISSPAPEAHKAITSKYTYNEDVFPILKERCSRCHYEGGPSLMSLMTYDAAVPWAESIREQLVARKMPPWYADPSGVAVKGGHKITSRELDTLVTWAVGGTPVRSIARWPT